MMQRHTPITARQFIELVERNSVKHFELTVDGEVIEVSPKRAHGRQQVFFAKALTPPEGYEVLTEVLHDIGGWLCQPDVSIDLQGDDEIITTPPLLAIEIKSETNTYKELRARARKYIERGTLIVWLVFPEKRVIEVYQADADDQLLTEHDTLSGGALLPDFNIALKEIFA